MYVVDDAKQREKMASAFYRSVRREIDEYAERANHLIQTGSQSAAIMERWAMRIQGLEKKKHEFEDVLRRELNELDDEFRSLGTLADELTIRARGLRVRKAA
jgi:DNA integrity scanning protein DisA with diadenylate cyclase activity